MVTLGNYEQIVNAGILYCTGLQLSWVDTTQLLVSDGLVRDAANEIDIIVDTNNIGTTINSTIVGMVNGLDTGTLSNNTWYKIYVIDSAYENVPAGFLLSLASQEVPYLPGGYGIYRRIGWVKTDTAATTLTPFFQVGNSSYRYYQWNDPVSTFSEINPTILTVEDIDDGVPPINTKVIINAEFLSDAAYDTFQLGTPSLTFDPPTVGTIVITSNVASGGPTEVNLYSGISVISSVRDGAATIIAAVSSADDALSVNIVGFEDYI